MVEALRSSGRRIVSAPRGTPTAWSLGPNRNGCATGDSDRTPAQSRPYPNIPTGIHSQPDMYRQTLPFVLCRHRMISDRQVPVGLLYIRTYTGGEIAVFFATKSENLQYSRTAAKSKLLLPVQVHPIPFSYHSQEDTVKQSILTREYQSAQDFQTAIMPFREEFCGYEPVELKNFVENYTGALGAFGTCELFMRQHDRASALAVYPGYQAYNSDVGLRQNDKGLEMLARAIDSFGDFKTIVEGEPPGLYDFTEGLNQFRRDFLDVVVGYEVKTSDVQRISALLEETITIALAQGELGVVNHVEQKLTELDALRRSPDRGTAENIPFWKAVGIAIMLGVVVAIVIRCINKRRASDCRILEKAAYTAGWGIGGLLVLFC